MKKEMTMDRADQNPEATDSKENEIILIDTDGDSEAEIAVMNLDGTHEVVIAENAEGAPEIIIVDLNDDDDNPVGETSESMGSEAAQDPSVMGSEAGQELPEMGSEAIDSGSAESLHSETGDISTSAEDTAAEQKAAEDTSGQATEEQQAAAEAQAHTDSAALAQQHADEDIQAGDYKAASQEREAAENEAWAGGDSSMLHGSDSTQLSHAADDLKEAEAHEAQEARDVEAGDYRAAREEAGNAATDTSWADFRAGGPDHTGQADAEYEKEDWAVWHQDHADSDMKSAVQEAEQGDLEHAQAYSESASSEQEKADTAGYEGMHGAEGAVHDPSSEVAQDTPVDDHSVVVDTDSDTGDDAGADTIDGTGSGAGSDAGSYDAGSSGSSYDAGVSDTSYDDV